MGGDDLSSDDEYLFDSRTNPRGTAISPSDDESGGKEDTTTAIKRKPKQENDATVAPSSKKRKRAKNNVAPTTKANLIIHAGRGIAFDGADAQATFFGTCYSHAVKMNVTAGDGSTDHETETGITEFAFLPHHFHANNKSEDIDTIAIKKQHSDLSIYLKQSNVIPSMKRLKNWKHNHSPMILIISLSARRCVELQKQLSYLKLPVAKLFAKHMKVEEQVELLKGGKIGDKGGKGKKTTKCYGIGVGTPGRLLALLRHGHDGAVNSGALRLNHTELVIIDCNEDSKGFTVCTLKDTAKELMDFMKEGIVNELDKRKDKIKLALF